MTDDKIIGAGIVLAQQLKKKMLQWGDRMEEKIKMTHDEMIAVIAAARDGKTVECRYKAYQDSWAKVNSPSWNFIDLDYRIEPEPVKKVMKWRWVLRDIYTNKLSITNLPSSKAPIIEASQNLAVVGPAQWTMIEVDEC